LQIVARLGSLRSASLLTAPVPGSAWIALVQVMVEHGMKACVSFIPAVLYRALGDPFEIAQRLPNWEGRTGEHEAFRWTTGPLPPRKVEDLHSILQAGHGPLLLGAAQALLDGYRIVLVRPEPQDELLAALWKLLPTRSQGEIMVATFAENLDLGCQVTVVPSLTGKPAPGTLSEEQVLDYPEGRYELALQIAIEGGNQAELEGLLARQTTQQMLKFVLILLAVFTAALLATRWIGP
jgi:hypothetical protein